MSSITNLSNFGQRELAISAKLLTAYSEGNASFLYSDEGVHLALNPSSGCVFLTNEEFEVIMLNGDKAELFFYDSCQGQEGFREDVLNEFWNYSGDEAERLDWIFNTVLHDADDKEAEFLKLLIQGIEQGSFDALEYLLSNTERLPESWIQNAIFPMFEKLDLSFLDQDEIQNLFCLVDSEQFNLALSIVGIDSLEDLQKQVC